MGCRKLLHGLKSLRKGSKNGSGMQHCKLKTLVKTIFISKVIMFKETLEFKNAIILCYDKQNSIALQQIIPKAQVWVIHEVITSTLNHIVLTYVMNQNQSKGHWLFLDVLIITIAIITEMEVLHCCSFLMGLKCLTHLKLKSSFCKTTCA